MQPPAACRWADRHQRELATNFKLKPYCPMIEGITTVTACKRRRSIYKRKGRCNAAIMPSKQPVIKLCISCQREQTLDKRGLCKLCRAGLTVEQATTLARIAEARNEGRI